MAPKNNSLAITLDIYYDIIDVAVLSNVLSELYNDPANSFIEIGDMARIARDKIQGESVDNKLLKARKKVLDVYEGLYLLKKMQAKDMYFK